MESLLIHLLGLCYQGSDSVLGLQIFEANDSRTSEGRSGLVGNKSVLVREHAELCKHPELRWYESWSPGSSPEPPSGHCGPAAGGGFRGGAVVVTGGMAVPARSSLGPCSLPESPLLLLSKAVFAASG